MPSAGKTKRGKSSRKTSRKKSELDSALDQVTDESVAASMKEFQVLLAQAKGDTSELMRQNAQELEARLILLKNERSTRKTLISSSKIKSAISESLSTANRRRRRNALRN
jgi:hypothetical protein